MSKQNEIKKLIQNDYAIVPIPYMKKAPTIQGWPKLKITDGNFEKYFHNNKSMNVGVINGKRSGNIVDIDIDSLTALDLAEKYLPQTGLIFGRKSKLRSHWIYVCDKLPKTTKFQSNEGCIIEIRADKTQTVWPPSVHPSKEIITYQSDGEPSKVKKEDLENACKIITVGSILIDNYPADGLRNDFALSLASVALRLFNMDTKAAKRFVLKIAQLAGDEEYKNRADIIEHTAKRMKNGETVLGIPSLKEFIGASATDDIARYILIEGSEEYDVIEELNQEYALVIVPPQTLIIKEIKTNNGHKDFIFLQISAFKNILGSRWLKNKKLATTWMESPMRRTYTGIEFAPTKPTDGMYNLWQGHPVSPKEGECGLFITHIRKNICDGNEEYAHYFISWLAHIIRNPEHKPGTSIVIRGKQGTGKSFVFKHFGKLLGNHYKVADSARYISGNFNSHLHDCLLLHLEEAFFAGDKKLEATLKELITGDQILMEYKGKEPIRAKNYASVAITTNSTWVIPAGLEERRFFVLDAKDTEMQNRAYFAAIANQLNDGGYEALMHYLVNYEYEESTLRDTPKTEALLEQKLHSLSHEEQWWLEVLQKGELPMQGEWTGVCGTSDMFRDYYNHANISGTRFKSAQTRLGIFLKKMVPDIDKQDGSYQTKYNCFDDEMNTEKGLYYVLPSLEDCRRAFEMRLGQDFDWNKW